METILEWGLDVIGFIQAFQTPLLNSIFQAITRLGGIMSFWLVLPFLFWCVDYKLGIRVTVLCSISAFGNFWLKDIFSQPRPFAFDPGVGIATARGYGLPSGHAQGSLVLWGSLAAWAQKKWFWVLAGIIVALIGLSRVYLGVHFPTDVLAGWAVGSGFLTLYFFLRPGIETWINGQSVGMKMLLSLVIPLGLLLMHPSSFGGYQLGMLAGVGIGGALKARYVPFCAGGTGWMGFVRYIIGITFLFVLLAVFRSAYPAEQTALYLVIAFLHSAINGVWISLGGPWLFRLLGLEGIRRARQNKTQNW